MNNLTIHIDYGRACTLAEKIQKAIPEGIDTYLFLTAIAILIEAHSYDPTGIDQQIEFLQKLSHELCFQQHLNNASEIGHA